LVKELGVKTKWVGGTSEESTVGHCDHFKVSGRGRSHR